MAVVVACYARTLFAGWIWDDDFYVWNNPTLRSLRGLSEIWFVPRATPQYYPLVHTSYWLEYRIWGDWPAGYHLVNVLLHAANAWLLWRVLVRLAVPAAWLGALLFAVHPVGVESVAWVTERKNTLSLCLALGSLLAWLEFREREATAAPGRWWWYSAALSLFAAALLAKTVTVTLAAALLVIEWWRSGRLTRRNLALTAPFFAVGLPLAFTTVWLEKHHVGASGAEWALTPAERLLVAGRAVWFYASKLLWPHPLVFFYPRWKLDPASVWQWAFPVTAAATLAGLWLAAGRIGRGPAATAMLFCGLLFPALGFFDVYPFRYSFVADHFQYHASAALLAGLAGGLGTLARRPGREWLPIAAATVCLPLAALTFRQTAIYRDVETLCRDTLAKNPSSWAARNILAPWLTDQGRAAEADRVYRELFACDDLPPWPHDLAMFRHNHGLALEALGRSAEAEAAYREAIRLDPHYPKPRNNLAKLLADSGRIDDATTAYRDLLALPLDDVARGTYAFNLGTVLAELERWPEAEAAFRESLAIGPAVGDRVEWLGIVAARQGRVQEAIGHFERALNLARDEAAAARVRANLTAARRAASITP